MNESKFRGTGVALVTPFKKDSSVDFNALEKLVDFVIDGGVNYLTALGTTAETPTLRKEEKLDILNCIIAKNNNRVPIVCGMGGNSTNEVIQQFDLYPMDKLDGILSVSPYYNKPSQAGIVAHYKEVSKHSPLPIILYNVPGRTGSNMLASTTLQLARECENIVAMKEASGNMVQCMELVHGRSADFILLSGDDNLAMAQIACGFDGVISVAANCFPNDFCKLIQYALNNDFTNARSLQYKLLEGIDLLFAEGNPTGAKCVLNETGICENELRLPMIPASAHLQESIQRFLQRYNY